MKKILFFAAMFVMIFVASAKAITINSPSNMSSQYANDFTVSWTGSSNVSVTYKLLMYYPSPGSENETGYGNITGTYTVSGYNTTIPLTSSQWGSAVGRFLKIYISDNSNGTAAATVYVLIKPRVTTGTATQIKTTSAYLNGTATYCTAIYYYRKSGTNSSWSGSYYPDISGLTPCTQYEYRVAGTGFPTNYLDEYIYGDVTNFTTLSNTPSTPGSISGSTTVCAGGGSQSYSISSVSGATSYTWTKPSGWTGSSTGTSITLTPSSSAVSGTVTVKANNDCGSSSTRSLSVTVNSVPSIPGNISGTQTVCAGGGSQSYSISSVSGATSYTWTLPSGWSGSSTGISISATPGSSAQSGYIRVKANNSCGSSSERTFSVTVNSPPTAPTSISGTNAITNGQNTTLTASGGSTGSGCTYQWGTGTCGNNIISGQTNSSITVSPTATTTYWVRRIGTSPCGSTTTSCATQSVTVSAKTYTVVYNGNGNTGGSTASSSHTYDVAKNLTANGFTKTGYTFAGWATSATGAVVYSNSQSVSNLTTTNGGTVNLYAKWTPCTYTVVYNGNGNTGGSTASSSHTYDVAKNLTANGFIRTGYIFAGWATSTSGAVVYSNSQSVSNLTTNGGTVNLYAKWNAPETYTVTLNKDGGTGGTSSVIVTYNAAMPSATAPTKTGYTFGGYYSSTNGSGTQYYNASMGSAKNWNLTSNTTLYAKWTANTYTIVYNGNGNTGGSTASSSHTYDVAKNLTANGFTRTGYTFAGWATSASGAVVYPNSQSVSNLTTTNGGTVNLYAKWTTTTVAVTSVSISGCSTGNLTTGQTRQLTATVVPSNATNQSVSWKSSNTSVATVNSSSGLVTAQSAGTATITVTTTDGNKTAICSVTVANAISGCDVILLKETEWNQTYPYNAKCPTVQGARTEYNGRAPTGCVATAMAQIMKYHKYPTTYDWKNMLDNYPNSNSGTTPQRDEIAKLMYDCGVAVQMEYRANNSGAGRYETFSALPTYFGYDNNTIEIIQRGAFNSTNNLEWDNRLRAELDAGRPVYYRGTNTITGGGHAFVCDGYGCTGANAGKFHFNWGWGGSANGYFATSALDIDFEKDGITDRAYNGEQGIIINIKPRPDYDYPTEVDGTSTFAISAHALTGGYIIPEGTAIRYAGENQPLSFVANSGYEIDQVFIDGNSNAIAKDNGYYIFSNVTANHSIIVTFKASSTGINNIQPQNKISIFPNPTKDEIFIQSEKPIAKVEILNIAGQVVISTKSTTFVNVSHLPKGIYFARIFIDGQIVTKKIIKE
jgi:uncharacterized repeat protein (TIGR02543 family)